MGAEIAKHREESDRQFGITRRENRTGYQVGEVFYDKWNLDDRSYFHVAEIIDDEHFRKLIRLIHSKDMNFERQMDVSKSHGEWYSIEHVRHRFACLDEIIDYNDYDVKTFRNACRLKWYKYYKKARFENQAAILVFTCGNTLLYVNSIDWMTVQTRKGSVDAIVVTLDRDHFGSCCRYHVLAHELKGLEYKVIHDNPSWKGLVPHVARSVPKPKQEPVGLHLCQTSIFDPEYFKLREAYFLEGDSKEVALCDGTPCLLYYYSDKKLAFRTLAFSNNALTEVKVTAFYVTIDEYTSGAVRIRKMIPDKE